MNDIEKRIHRGMNQLAPDVFQNVLADNSPKLRSEYWLTQDDRKQSQNFWMRAARTAAVLAACCLLILGLTMHTFFLKVDSVVEIDVNPSLELWVNQKNRVVRLNALNADGVKILDDTGENLKHKKLEKAVQVLVNIMVEDGYLAEDKNSVLISVDHIDADRSAKLQQIVTDNVKEVLNEDQITGVVYHQSYSVNSDLTEMSVKYGISPGKAAFIQRLIALRPELSIEELSMLTISEITELLRREQVDVSQYMAMRQIHTPKEPKDISKDAEFRYEQLVSRMDEKPLFTDEKIKPKRPDRENAAEEEEFDRTPEQETTPPADGDLVSDGKVVIDEMAGGIQEGSEVTGSADTGRPDSQPENPGWEEDTSIGEKPETPENPDIGKLPGEDNAVEEAPGPDGNLNAGGEGTNSGWEDTEGMPAELREHMDALTGAIDSLKASIHNLVQMEEGDLRNQEYERITLEHMKAVSLYVTAETTRNQMLAAESLDVLSMERAAKILMKAEESLVKMKKILSGYAPVYPLPETVCPDGE